MELCTNKQAWTSTQTALFSLDQAAEIDKPERPLFGGKSLLKAAVEIKVSETLIEPG